MYGKKKIAAVVLKAKEEAAATTAAATTALTANTSATTGTPSNACLLLVLQVVVQPPCGPTPEFGCAASVGGPTYAPPGMQQHGPRRHITMAVTAPTLLVILRQSIKDVTALIQVDVAAVAPQNLGFTIMILLQNNAGHKKSMLPNEN